MVEKSNNDDWSKMLGRLLTFKREHGHWNVTEDWPENQDLVQWIQIQREKKTNGQLPPERVEELEKLGFPGSIEERTLPSEDTAEKHPPIFDEGSAYEKLYFIGVGKYVQYGGNGEKPQELLDYADRHNGEFPPHIPLPNRPGADWGQTLR